MLVGLGTSVLRPTPRLSPIVAPSAPRTGITTAAHATGRQRRDGSRPSGKSSSISGKGSNITGCRTTETQATSTPAGNEPDATSSVRAAYSQAASTTAMNAPRARHSQPTRLPGRREATTAPTVAYAGIAAGTRTSHKRISER
jgi:hypothetical protein